MLPEECFSAEHSSLEFEEETSADFGLDEVANAPAAWTIGRRFEEFYGLEDRLREQYGPTLRLAALPDRKTTLQLLQAGRNTRALLDTHRVHFERFLQHLVVQVQDVPH